MKAGAQRGGCGGRLTRLWVPAEERTALVVPPPPPAQGESAQRRGEPRSERDSPEGEAGVGQHSWCTTRPGQQRLSPCRAWAGTAPPCPCEPPVPRGGGDARAEPRASRAVSHAGAGAPWPPGAQAQRHPEPVTATGEPRYRGASGPPRSRWRLLHFRHCRAWFHPEHVRREPIPTRLLNPVG